MLRIINLFLMFSFSCSSNLSSDELNFLLLIWVKTNKIKIKVVIRKNCISKSSNQGKSKKANVEKPNMLVNEVKLKNRGIPQQKKCVRQLNRSKYEDKNLIMRNY